MTTPEAILTVLVILALPVFMLGVWTRTVNGRLGRLEDQMKELRK